MTDAEIARIRGLLLRLHSTRREALLEDERRIYDLFRNDREPNRFLLAAEDGRVHAQRGIMERFTNGLRTSRQYLPEMERIFRAEGLPVKLARLPLIESCSTSERIRRWGRRASGSSCRRRRGSTWR